MSLIDVLVQKNIVSREDVPGIEREMEHECIPAANGLEGLLKLKEMEGKIDCVLVDYHMDTLNGAEFVAQMEANIPVAFITADPEGLMGKYPMETRGRLVIDKKNFFDNMKKLKVFIDEAKSVSPKTATRP